MPVDEFMETNRANWDSRAAIHYGSDIYGIQRFLDDPNFVGEVASFDAERMPPLTGKKLLHLQCHIGTDTIGLARHGAEVTGVDISPKSIELARQLSEESGTPARFLVSEMYDAPSVLGEPFDVVYTGVGAICWLPDIAEWGRVVGSFLEPGGIFYMREAHPIVWTIDDERDDDEIVIKWPYFEIDKPTYWEEETTYAGEGVLTSKGSYEWNHGVAEVLQALIDAGLRIDRVEDYDSLEWESGPINQLGEDGRFRLKEGRERLPLMWSILATKT